MSHPSTPEAALDTDSVNHVGMAVRDLHAAAARYEAMGFLLTPFSRHAGAWKPGEPVQAFHSGNRCLMFRHNYLEILASEDPRAPAPRMAGFLRHHQGAHIICFNSEDVHAANARVAAAGVKTSGVIPLQRDIDTPEGVRTAKFERVQLAPDDSPEGYIQTARHLTPQYIYQQRYIAHPNGSTELSEVWLVTDDLEHFARKYAAYTGLAPRREGPVLHFDFPLVSRLTLVHYREAGQFLPGTLLPPIPGIAAVAFRTQELEALRSRLAGAGIAAHEAPGNGLLVPAEEAFGLAMLFRP